MHVLQLLGRHAPVVALTGELPPGIAQLAHAPGLVEQLGDQQGELVTVITAQVVLTVVRGQARYAFAGGDHRQAGGHGLEDFYFGAAGIAQRGEEQCRTLLQLAQVRAVAEPFDARVVPVQFPADWQRMPGYRQAHRRVAHPHLRHDVFQRPLDGFQIGAILEVAHEQQALAMQRRLHVLVEITIHTIDHHVHRAPADLRDQLGIVSADRHQLGRLA